MKNLARLLFKPRWQDKNPQVRRAAVVQAHDAELTAALPQISREDADAGVRLAALKRLDDYETWRERSTGDADGQVRMTARNAYVALLCSDDARVPSLARRIAELDTLSAAEIEDVATRARDRDLRAAALERVARPALLADRALTDPDARLRAAALERIHDIAVLERIAERARKTDKAINRRARELAASMRIGTGDVRAIAEKAQMLCARAEALLRSAQAQDTEARAAIEREWGQLGGAEPAELQGRFRAALSLLRQMQTDLLAPKPRVEVAAATPHAESAQPAESLAAAVASIDLLAAQARVHASLAAAAEAAKREREQHRVLLRDAEQLSDQYAARLETGDVYAVHELHIALDRKLKLLGDLPAALAARLAPLHARYAELAHWQRWSNDQRRVALCAEIEALPAAGLHPDALATRVREARPEWQRLDASHGASDVEYGLARRFNALCHRVLKPTRTYFEKRDAVRRSHADEIEALLQANVALPDEIVDWKAASTLRRQLGDALRELDTVDPRERTAMAKRLKEAIAKLAPRIDAHLAGIESARDKLIERAAALVQRAEPGSAARDVRELQREWTSLGQGRRAADQRQWNAFRQHCDAVFGKLDTARNERTAADAAARAQAEALLAEIDALHRDASQPLDVSQAALRSLAARWQALASPERALEQRYRKAHEAASLRLQGAVRAQRLSRFTLTMEKYALLRKLESGAVPAAEISERWAAQTSVTGVLAGALNARYAHAGEQSIVPPAEDANARMRLVELEFLAGVDTAAEDRDLRMNYQLQRLASRMRERTNATPEAELEQILAAWFAQSPQPDALETRFAQAALAAVNSLP